MARGATHDTAWRLDHPWEERDWQGRTLRVPSLDPHPRIERSRGRVDRARGIETAVGAVT